jgi:uncharacterized protein YebE (UPF0316 family)
MEVLGWQIPVDVLEYVLLPLFIFFARICDVSIGTIRIIMISRGNRPVAAALGFFEVIIWLLAVSQVLSNLNNLTSYIAYGAGFAAGNYLGISIESRLALGMQAVHIVTESNLKVLSMLLREAGFGVTNLEASGQRGQLEFIYVVTPRSRVKEVIGIVREFDDDAFISVTDLRSSYSGFIAAKTNQSLWSKGIVKKK